MDIQDLRYFVAAYESAEMARGDSQPLEIEAARRVLRLEKLTGQALFERRDARVLPTAAGQALYAYVRERLASSSKPGETTIVREEETL